MKQMRRISSIVFLCIINLTINAQSWSLDECIKYALEHSLDIRKSELNIKTSHINHSQSKLFYLPSLNMSASPNYNIGYSINPATYSYENVNSITGSIGLNAEVILFQGNQNVHNIRKSKNEWLSAQEEKKNAEMEVTVNVINLYFQTLIEKEIYRAIEKKLSIAQKQLEKISEFIKLGKQSLSDRQEVDVQISREKANLLKQKNIINLSIFKLKQYIQLYDKDDFDIDQISQSIERDNDGRVNYKKIVQQLPQINAKKFNLNALEQKLEMDKGSRYPSLAFSYGIGSNFINTAKDINIINGITSTIGYVNDKDKTEVYSYPQSYQTYGQNTSLVSQLNTNLQQRLTLSLQVPIFDKFKKANQIKLTQIAIESQLEDIKKQESKMIEELETMKINRDNALVLFESNREIVKSYESLLDIQRSKYDQGFISNFEFQNAVNNYYISALELSKSRIEYQYRNVLYRYYLER